MREKKIRAWHDDATITYALPEAQPFTFFFMCRSPHVFFVTKKNWL